MCRKIAVMPSINAGSVLLMPATICLHLYIAAQQNERKTLITRKLFSCHLWFEDFHFNGLSPYFAFFFSAVQQYDSHSAGWCVKWIAERESRNVADKPGEINVCIENCINAFYDLYTRDVFHPTTKCRHGNYRMRVFTVIYDRQHGAVI